mgnify:CR=1
MTDPEMAHAHLMKMMIDMERPTIKGYLPASPVTKK